MQTTILIVMTSLIFWACSSYFIHWNTMAYQREASNAITEATRHASESIGNLANGELRMLDGIADSITEIDYSNWTETKEYLRRLAEKFKFDRISIVSEEGIGYSSDGAIWDASGEEGFMRALQGSNYIAAPFIDKITGEEIVTFNSPIEDDDNIVGVLSASRHKQDIYGYIGVSFFNGQGYSHIIDQSGRVLLRSPHPNADTTIDNVFDVMGRDSENKDELQRFKQDVKTKQSGGGMFTLNGKEKLVGYSPIQEVNGWYILSVIPEKVILSKAYEMSRATLLLCIGMFIFLAGVCVVLLIGRRNNRREIEKIAFIDELTQLPRMRKFRLDMKRLMEKNPKFKYAIAQFDIEEFKYTNEILGFQEGNNILIQLANTLRDHKSDGELIGRLGGDRFLLMTSYIDRDELTNRLHTLIAKLSDFKSDGDEPYRLVINCGIYCIEDNGMDSLMMIDRAGIACKSIKGGYSSTCGYFNDELLAQIVEEQVIVNRMQFAMEQDEFKIYLQPKADVHTNHILGAEALVRWDDPHKGLISPLTFIPIFERNRFIVKLDLWVFDSVCRLLHKWLQQGRSPHPISVNISLLTLYKSDLLTQLIVILERYDIPVTLIEIEITESIVFENLEKIRARLMELKDMGFTIAIDDFGSGYSSLNVLQHIPADVIKLDRVFLMSRSNDETGKTVIAAMVELAKKLGMRIVAEGVETQEQVEFLKAINCEIAQGYHYAKPMPIERFEQLYYDDKEITA